MTKWKKLFVSFLTLCMLFTLSSVSVMAADPYTYTVTLYTGNKGTINGDSKAVQSGLAAGSYVYLATKNVTVTDEKYYIKGIRLSGHDNAEIIANPSFTVNSDADYVVAYGIKANMVSYTVNYQDAAGKALTTSGTYYGDVGDKPVVAYRYISGYIPQALALTKTLSENEAENVFTFIYTPGETGENTVTETTVVTTVGGTTTTTGTAGTTTGTTAGTTGTTTGTTGTTGTTTGTTGTTDGTTGPGTPQEAAGAADGNQAAQDAANGTTDGTDGTVTSPDGQTPQGVVDLDEGTPEANIDASSSNNNNLLIIGGIAIGVAALAALAALFIGLKRRTK